jgi:type I restriction enzyme R subunit
MEAVGGGRAGEHKPGDTPPGHLRTGPVPRSDRKLHPVRRCPRRSAKVLAKYHQALGVNRAIEAVQKLDENRGRLGVFWHTQGSGKSLSMVMFAEKVLRRLGGNWTFVIVTDRQELDDQIAGTFATVGALTKKIEDAQAQSRVHLRELLAGQERYVFTLIHKFSTDGIEQMPVLSQRRDIIVITDEAHRSQYDQLAANMRQALPNAAFIGFTGTPLIAGQGEGADPRGLRRLRLDL